MTTAELRRAWITAMVAVTTSAEVAVIRHYDAESRRVLESHLATEHRVWALYRDSMVPAAP